MKWPSFFLFVSPREEFCASHVADILVAPRKDINEIEPEKYLIPETEDSMLDHLCLVADSLILIELRVNLNYKY